MVRVVFCAENLTTDSFLSAPIEDLPKLKDPEALRQFWSENLVNVCGGPVMDILLRLQGIPEDSWVDKQQSLFLFLSVFPDKRGIPVGVVEEELRFEASEDGVDLN